MEQKLSDQSIADNISNHIEEPMVAQVYSFTTKGMGCVFLFSANVYFQFTGFNGILFVKIWIQYSKSISPTF
jgi:hypothetical protein